MSGLAIFPGWVKPGSTIKQIADLNGDFIADFCVETASNSELWLSRGAGDYGQTALPADLGPLE